MKQVLQNLRSGTVRLAEVANSTAGAGEVLVATRASLISLGTERSIIELGRKSMLGKARSRPDLVKRVVEKAKTEGLATTISQVINRLDQPLPLGYSSAGIVIGLGRNANRFAVGDRLACVGQGHASHAEIVAVPEMLCARLPDQISFEAGAFGMVGSIGLHGIRCANLTFGETVVVTGLGLIGLLTAQMLRAYGCRVLAADVDPNKLALARSVGIENVCEFDDVPAAAKALSGGLGVDAVLLTLASDSADSVHQAVRIVRTRGRIVVVGVADIHPLRNEMWANEAEIIVSRAAGPGSLEEAYELGSVDYPPGYVRWTEGRNLEEFLRLVGSGQVRVNELITHRFPISEAERAYRELLDGKGGGHVGVVFEYSSAPPVVSAPPARAGTSAVTGKPRIAVIGAGLFGQSVLIPALRKADVALHSISSSDGATASNVARRFGFAHQHTSHAAAIADPNADAVMVLTRHRSHARLVIEALAARKHVFVEKPLCVDRDELAAVERALKESPAGLTVGYNRRFSPLSEALRAHFAGRRAPAVINYRVNAGFVPAMHWVHAPEEGGSRIVGEVCHFVDLMQFFTGSQPTRVYAERVGGDNASVVNNDNVVITLRFADGSVGSIAYTGSGARASGRERVEMYADGRSALLEDFRSVQLFHESGSSRKKLWNQDLGYGRELAAFAAAVRRGDGITIPIADILLSTACVFAIDESLQSGQPESVG